jgi:hypothetical protein
MTIEKRSQRMGESNSRNIKHCAYIHIWASDDEIRVQSTDPVTLRVLIRTIENNYSDCNINTRNDLNDQVYIVKIIAMELENRHQKIAWWLFKMLCERGWEPMATGERWYKMKKVE